MRLINSAFPVYTNTIFTKDGRLGTQEVPTNMFGQIGTNDQRMASHAFTSQFFYQMDMSEMEMYARTQRMTPQNDGRIPHEHGNFTEAFENPFELFLTFI